LWSCKRNPVGISWVSVLWATSTHLLGAFGHHHNNRQKIVQLQKSIRKRRRTRLSKTSVPSCSPNPGNSRNAHRITVTAPPCLLQSKEFFDNLAPHPFPMPSSARTILCLLCRPRLKALSICLAAVQTLETQEMPTGFAYSSTITSPINRILDNLVRLHFPMLSRVCTIF
jgi:hypothetical protein